MTKTQSRWRKLKAGWRDTTLLLSQFRRPLAIFVGIMVAAGSLYFYLANLAGEPVRSLLESIYMVLSMSFFQPSAPFPQALQLQLFYFIMPVLGIGLAAQGLADFGFLFFNRRSRGKEWEMAVASTFNNHIVLIGLGHLGYRVVKKLHELEQEVVVITLDTKIDLVESIRALSIPVIQDDGTRESVLESAGVRSARAILLCTQNDSLNLQMALKARGLNPAILVVVRIFDDDFAQSLQKQFGFHALSATGIAAPIFASSAANVDITPPITIEGTPHSLARMEVAPKSALAGLPVSQVEQTFNISVVLVIHNGITDFHPAGAARLEPGDRIAVLGHPEDISILVHKNHA